MLPLHQAFYCTPSVLHHDEPLIAADLGETKIITGLQHLKLTDPTVKDSWNGQFEGKVKERKRKDDGTSRTWSLSHLSAAMTSCTTHHNKQRMTSLQWAR